MQAILDLPGQSQRAVSPKLIGKIASTRLEGINLRAGVLFRFPIERYAEQILPS
jgi:hypothetical protein